MESLAVKLASCLEPDKMHFSWLALSLPPVHTLTLQLLLLDTGSLSLDEKESIAKVDALIWRSDLAKLSGQGNNYRPLAVILEDGLTLKTYERFPNIPHLFKSRSISMLIFLFLEPISQERAITVQLLYSCLALTRLSQRGRSSDHFGVRDPTFEAIITKKISSWRRWEPGGPAGTDNFESLLSYIRPAFLHGWPPPPPPHCEAAPADFLRKAPPPAPN